MDIHGFVDLLAPSVRSLGAIYLSGNLHAAEQNLHQQYGPVVRTGPGSLSFSTPEAFESIYGFNHSFEKGDFYTFARDPATGASNIFSARTYAEHRDRRRKVEFVVFSKGSRGCIGKEIAMLIVTQAVAGILSKWRIEGAGQMKGSEWLEMQVEWCGLKLTNI